MNYDTNVSYMMYLQGIHKGSFNGIPALSVEFAPGGPMPGEGECRRVTVTAGGERLVPVLLALVAAIEAEEKHMARERKALYRRMGKP